MRIRDALSAYIEQHGPRIRSAEQARIAARKWARFWGDLSVSDMSRERQERFHAWLDASGSPAYVRRTIGVGRAAISYAGAEPPVTVHYVAPFTSREHVNKGLSLDEARALWSAAQAQEHWRRYLWLAFGTGARPEALLQLRRCQIEDGTIHLAPPGWRATKKRRPSLPMPGVLAREIAGWDGDLLVSWRGRAVARASMMFRRMGRECGVQATPYAIRRSVATALHRAGVDLWEIAQWLGHAPPGSATTARYIQHRPDWLASAKSAVDDYLTAVCDPAGQANELHIDGRSWRLPAEAAEDLGRGLLVQPLNLLVGARGIEPRTPTMSRYAGGVLPARWEWIPD